MLNKGGIVLLIHRHLMIRWYQTGVYQIVSLLFTKVNFRHDLLQHVTMFKEPRGYSLFVSVFLCVLPYRKKVFMSIPKTKQKSNRTYSLQTYAGTQTINVCYALQC